MKYSHVIFDLDGTLLPNNLSLNQSELRFLGDRLRDLEVLVVFATGRSLVKVLELEGVVDALSPVAIVTNCGAEIFLKQDGCFVCDESYLQYVDTHSFSFDKERIEKYLDKEIFLTQQESKYQFNYKISYYIDLNKCISVRSFVDNFKQRFNNHELLISLAEIESGLHYLDVQPFHASKYGALAYMLESIGIEEKDVWYFGDNGNDLPCILGFEQSTMITTYKDCLVEIYPELLNSKICWIENSGPISLLESLDAFE